jgi:hypothetical protein
MTAYPAAGDYYKAVQAPARSFTVPKLQAAEFVWDSLGPSLARGSSAVVFQAAVEGTPQALRCYIRNDASSRDRYSALDAYLASYDLSPYVSGTTWLDSAIRVNRETWPVLTMDWIDGRTLNEYVDFLVVGSNAAALTTLAARWRGLVALLQDGEFAHGDLQHGNVMVDQEGRLRLVDFDGVWIPQLAGQAPPSEFGHPNYQHPRRHTWDRWLDTFSALVVYLSLVALGKDPGLWLALYKSKNLLFSKPDFFLPFKTEAWKQLAELHDPQVDELVRRLQECCDPEWVSDKSLEMTLNPQPVTPALQPIPVEQRWWENKPASAGPVAPARPVAPASPVAPAGPGVPAVHSSWPWAPGSPSAGQPPPPVSAPSAPAAPAAASPAAAATAAAQAATMQFATASLPAPPPLSAPLGLAGTGPMPQLRQTMAPPGATWWAGPAPSASSSGQARQPQARQPQARQPQAPQPQAPQPQARQPGLWAPAPAPPASVPKPQQGRTAGAIALGLGVVLLIAGAASHTFIFVIIGLIAGGWALWRLVTLSGKNQKPPGQT